MFVLVIASRRFVLFTKIESTVNLPGIVEVIPSSLVLKLSVFEINGPITLLFKEVKLFVSVFTSVLKVE